MTAIWSAESGHKSAPLVALIHGSMDRSAGMLRLSRRLDDRYRVLRYDRRGYGRSAAHAGPYGIDHQVGDLFALLGGRRATLVGHSYGGNVALAFAARHRHLVDGVLAYESPLSWMPWWPADTAGGTALATQGDPGDAAECFMRRLIGDVRWERLPPSTRRTRRSEGAAMVGELSDLRAVAPWTPDEIAVPVLAVRGELGAGHHRRGMQFVSDEITSARLHVVAGAHHYGPNTHADVISGLVDELRSFVEQPDRHGDDHE